MTKSEVVKIIITNFMFSRANGTPHAIRPTIYNLNLVRLVLLQKSIYIKIQLLYFCIRLSRKVCDRLT